MLKNSPRNTPKNDRKNEISVHDINNNQITNNMDLKNKMHIYIYIFKIIDYTS